MIMGPCAGELEINHCYPVRNGTRWTIIVKQDTSSSYEAIFFIEGGVCLNKVIAIFAFILMTFVAIEMWVNMSVTRTKH